MFQLTVLCEITIDGKDVQQSGQAQVRSRFNLITEKTFWIALNHKNAFPPSWLINMETLSAEAKTKQQDLSRETLDRLRLPAPIWPV